MNSILILIEVWCFNEVFYKTATPLSSSKAKQTMDVQDKNIDDKMY